MSRAHFYHPTRWERRVGRKPKAERADLTETIRAVNAAFPSWWLRQTGHSWVEGEVYLRERMHK